MATKKFSYRSEIRPDFLKNITATDRPADALVELVDNAVDAGATKVSVVNDELNGEIVVKDNGRGFDMTDEETIKKQLNYGGKIKGDDKIGQFNYGIKAIPYLFANSACDRIVTMEIESVRDGKRMIVEKQIDITNPSEKDFENNISISDTLSTESYTKVTIKGVHFELTERMKFELAARYYELMKNGFAISFDGKKCKPVDMFYENNNKVEVLTDAVNVTYEGKQYAVPVKLVDLKPALRRSTGSGSSSTWEYNDDKMNALDMLESQRFASTKYNGTYIKVNGILLNLGDGGFDNVGRNKHQYLNGCRMEVVIPKGLKHLLTNPLKGATKVYLCDLRDNEGKRIFEPVMEWFKQNSPSKKKRQQTNEDTKKSTKNKLYEANTEMVSLCKELKEMLQVELVSDEVKEKVERLMALIMGSQAKRGRKKKSDKTTVKKAA